MRKWKFIGNSNIDFISIGHAETFGDGFTADVICVLPDTENSILTLQQVLLNERYASFGYWVTEESYCQAGGRNEQLKQGWQYELLIRLAANQKIACISDKRIKEEWAASSDFYTDAYVLSRYAEVLQENHYFDAFLEDCVQRAMQSEDKEAIYYLEAMLSKSKKYWEIYRATQPFLILLGGNFCYNILNDMAENLAHGLRFCGKKVEICDLAADNKNALAQLIGKHFQAVIGFQSFLSSVYLKDRECYLTDLIYGPKLEFVFDHPFWFYEQLEHHGKDCYILTHDENYLKFIRENEPSVDGSFLVPPGGKIQSDDRRIRDLELVFLGTYNNYRDIVANLYMCDRKIRHMAACYLKYLKKRVNASAEWAFSQMLNEYGVNVSGETFAHMMYQMGNVCQCIMYYYREKMIRVLLDSGLNLHVYGESWRNSPFFELRNLICHKEVTAEDSFKVLQRAKISLNILAWHKGGCNERIINSLLAGAVVVTDKSSYIEKHFSDGRELCYYDLQELEKLPERIKKLIVQGDYRQQIADNGREKAEAEYSAAAQAKRIIDITQQIKDSNGRGKSNAD